MAIVSEVVICGRLFIDSTPSDLDDKAHAVAVSIYTRSRCFFAESRVSGV